MEELLVAFVSLQRILAELGDFHLYEDYFEEGVAFEVDLAVGFEFGVLSDGLHLLVELGEFVDHLLQYFEV